MADALVGGFTSLLGGAINEVLFAGPARRQHNADMERYADERYKREKASIDQHNLATKQERSRVLGAKKTIAYRTSVAQMADAKRLAQRFHLLSQDFLHAAGTKQAQQVVAYAGSGALIKGSALKRLEETRQRGDVGAARLRKAADIALRRGSQQAQVTRESVIAPMYVPTSDPIKSVQPPMRSSFSPLGSFWSGFGPGIQSDYAKGNWPFGGGGGGQGGGGGTGGGFNADSWGVTQRGGYNY